MTAKEAYKIAKVSRSEKIFNWILEAAQKGNATICLPFDKEISELLIEQGYRIAIKDTVMAISWEQNAAEAKKE